VTVIEESNETVRATGRKDIVRTNSLQCTVPYDVQTRVFRSLQRPTRRSEAGLAFPITLNSLSVFACDNLDLGCIDKVVAFHLKRSVLDDKSPNVVAKTVCV